MTWEENEKSLCRFLLKYSKEFGVSELSKKSGVNRVTIYEIINGKGNPSLKTLLKITAALDIRMMPIFEVAL